MPKLIIDNRSIEVPPGTKVIAAAEKLGIIIPRFCYHPALGSVGACRVCAVKVLEGRAKGIQMSCMLAAEDGMVVSTTDEEAVAFRRYVIEWLMLHHPHDCPVCDEGGHCLLQDTTVSGGHGLRRYRGPKRTYRDQYLGPLVQHEMNRCIQCYRCVRYYREYAGYEDLGVMGIGNRVYYGRFEEGALESPFAGNLIDVCPTGVYTDKPSRFMGRRWDFERTPAICIHCSLGCAITVDARYREVVRHEARFNPMVNGYFICDRGRYGYPYASAADRPREAVVDGHRTDAAAACRTAGERLADLASEHGPQSVALAGSVRCSLETMDVLSRACRSLGWRGPVFFEESRRARTVGTAVARLAEGPADGLPAVEAADFLLLAGVDPVNEAPMLALALHQARRKGADVVLADPRPVALPFDYQHLPLRPGEIGPWLERLIAPAGNVEGAEAEMNRRLRAGERPVIIAGTDILSPQSINRAADLANRLVAEGKQAGLLFTLPGPNAFGAALCDDTRLGLDKVVADIESGAIRALVLAESDAAWRFPDQERLERALARLELLVVLDHVASPLTDAAHVFLPTGTVYESGGVFINNAGRAQRAPTAMRGGTPISQTGQGDHPPRIFRETIPGGRQEAAWMLVTRLAAAAAGEPEPADPAAPPADLNERERVLSDLIAGELPPEGLLVTHAAAWRPPQTPEGEASAAVGEGEGLQVIWTDRIFGSEPLSALAPALQEMQAAPFLLIGSEDAAAWQLRDGEQVATGSGEDRWVLTVRIVADMAPGIVVMPRLPGWQRCGLTGDRIRRGDIRQGR